MINWSEQRILIIAPHPDDEVIGCGGLIAKAKQAGAEVYVQFLTVGDTTDFSEAGRSTEEERLSELGAVCQLLGINGYDVAFLGTDFHLHLDRMSQAALICMLERTSPLSLMTLKPSVVLFPDGASYNQDHRAAAQATITALRPSDPRYKHQPEVALQYEEAADVWTLSERRSPNLFVSLEGEHLDMKLRALALYGSQAREPPNARSQQTIHDLARLRGAHCGVPLAEAYTCVRWMV